jgi:outer membrane protein TolC
VSAQADLERRRVLATSARALVDNQLRPGADASRADAERAAAEIRLIHARAAETVALMQLSRLLGIEGGVATDAANVLERFPPADTSFRTSSTHPVVQVRQAAVEDARMQQRILARSNLPRLLAQSSVFARGSGAGADGFIDSGAGGLGLDRVNWAAGFQLVVPNLFEFSALRGRKAAAAAATRAQAAFYDESVLAIGTQQQAAGVMMQAAYEVAKTTPEQLAAARQSESQARARYEAGLASIIEVAEAQSLLALAETQDQLARVDVWRAAVASSVAWGDLASLVQLLAP